MNQLYWDGQRKIRSCEKLGITQGQWAYIKRVGSILRKLYENDCNGFQDKNGNEDITATKRNQSKIEKYEHDAYAFSGHNGLYLFLQGDCRGATIYLDKKAIPKNNYTNAVCIY